LKIGILSDIHSNIIALRTVLDEAKRQKVDHLFLLGDQLGYYYEAKEVYSLINEWSFDMINGNHEHLFLEYLDASDNRREEISNKYGNCFSHYQKVFSAQEIEEIKKLQDQKLVKLDGLVFLLCHGATSSKDQYIYPTTELDVLHENDLPNVDFIFNGHTHYPMVYCGKHSLFINVGSVGQSRTVGGVANWGIINTENNVYTPQNTPYNIEEQISLLKSYKEENRYLSKILTRNNKIYEK